MSKIIVLLFLFTKCFAFDLPPGCKNDLTIDKRQYNVTTRYDTGDAVPTDAHYDSKGNLFFVLFGCNYDGFYFDIKVIKPNSSTPQSIPGLPERESYSIAVDKKDSKVYFGTSKGIYAYNYNTQDATFFYKPDMKLNSLIVDKDGNKYVTGRHEGYEQLYLLEGKEKIHFSIFDSLDEVAVDDKNNFYYIRQDKLFVLKSNLSQALVLGNVTYEGLGQITFHKESVFIASKTLSYIHENDTGPLKPVTNAPNNVTAVAFDGAGNLVLGTTGKILKYAISNQECYLRKDFTKARNYLTHVFFNTN